MFVEAMSHFTVGPMTPGVALLLAFGFSAALQIVAMRLNGYRLVRVKPPEEM